ncbi:MAG TPA: hypothetical protein DD734_11495 [Firmicutes bacterium]|nr:hypothetical protein [Bacillota bacterium]
MQFVMRKIRFLLVCLILLIALSFYLGFKVLPSTASADRIKTLVEQEMSRYFSAEVKIKEVGLFFFSPELREVQIRTAEGEPALTAEKIRVGLDWFRLMTQRSFEKGLRNLDVMGTTVWLWDTLSLFGGNQGGEGKEGGGKVPSITIKLNDCQLIMEEAGKNWTWGNFYNLSGLVDLRSFPLIQVVGEGKSSLDPEASAKVEVAYATQNKQGKLLIKADTAAAPLWSEKAFRLLKFDDQLKGVDGKFNGELSLFIQNGKVNVDSTRLSFVDSRWEFAALPYPVENLDAKLLVSSTGIMVQNLQGSYREGRISLHGNLATAALGLDLSLYATGLDPADWTKLIPQLEPWEPAGLVDLNLQIGGEISSPRLVGEVRMTDGRLTLPGSPTTVEEFCFLARLSDDGVQLSYVKGRIEDAPFLVQGQIRGFQDPTLDLQGEVKRLPVEWLSSSALALSDGWLDASLHVDGPLTAPEIKGEIRARQLQAEGTVLRDLNLAGVYQWNTDHLRVDRLAACALDGRLTATGELMNLVSGAPFLRLEAKAEGVDLAQLSTDQFGVELPNITGRAGLQLSLEGPLSALSGAAELKVSAGSVDRFSYDQFQLLFSGDHDRLTVRGTLQEKEGTLIATGMVQPGTGSYEGELFLRGLTIDDRLLPQALPAVSGSINGLLEVRGNFNDLDHTQGQGWLDVYDLIHNDRELGVIKLKGQVDDGRLNLSDSFLLTTAGQIMLTGSVDWQDEPVYDITASGEDLLFEDLAALFPDFPPVALEGLTAFRLTATGWEKPQLAAEVSMAGIVLNDYYVGDGSVDLRWQDGEICFDQLRIGSAPMQLRGIGKLCDSQELDLDVAVEDFPLTALEPLLGRYLDNQEFLGKIAGSLTGEGRLRGTFQEPIFEGNLSVTQPVFAGFAVDRIAGDLVWKDRKLSFNEMVVSRGQEELTAYGLVDWTGAAPDLDLGLKMDQAGLADLLLLTGRAPNFHLDGEVTGYVRIFGALDQPRIRLITQIEKGEINDFSPFNGELDLQIYDAKITVNRLLLDDGTGEFFASGVYIPGTQVEIIAESRDFPLKPLVALTGRADLPTVGRFNLDLALTTTSEGMQGEFEALLKDTAWGNINVASLGLNGQITDDLVFLEAEDLGANRLSMQGSLPLNPAWFGPLQLPTSWPHRFSQIDLGISAEKMEASALNAFFKEPQITGGTIDGLISLNGTWRNPYLVGLLEITNGRGRVAALPTEVRDVNGLLSISPQGLEFRGLNNREGSYLEGRLGNGRFRLGGRVIMDGLKLEAFALRLTGDNLYLAPSFFDGLVGGELALTGPFTQPMLQGKVTVRKARIELPEGGGPALPFDLNLDLACEAANDVYFRMYGMTYIPFNGSIHVGGSLRKPELDGKLNSTRGWVNILGDTFRIKNLTAEFRPDYKLYPYLDLEATRNLAGTEVTISTAGWSGELENLVINPSSNPPKSREEILKLLNWPEKIEDGTLTFANVFRENINMVGDLFIGRVLDEFRSIMPIDFLTLEQDRQEGSFWMNMGKSLSEDLYLSYSRNLSSYAEQVWNLEWKLVPNFSLLGDYSAADGLRWKFQYNLRF